MDREFTLDQMPFLISENFCTLPVRLCVSDAFFTHISGSSSFSKAFLNKVIFPAFMLRQSKMSRSSLTPKNMCKSDSSFIFLRQSQASKTSLRSVPGFNNSGLASAGSDVSECYQVLYSHTHAHTRRSECRMLHLIQ